jgi:hypothetical protein
MRAILEHFFACSTMASFSSFQLAKLRFVLSASLQTWSTRTQLTRARHVFQIEKKKKNFLLLDLSHFQQHSCRRRQSHGHDWTWRNLSWKKLKVQNHLLNHQLHGVHRQAHSQTDSRTKLKRHPRRFFKSLEDFSPTPHESYDYWTVLSTLQAIVPARIFPDLQNCSRPAKKSIAPNQKECSL